MDFETITQPVLVLTDLPGLVLPYGYRWLSCEVVWRHSSGLILEYSWYTLYSCYTLLLGVLLLAILVLSIFTIILELSPLLLKFRGCLLMVLTMLVNTLQSLDLILS